MGQDVLPADHAAIRSLLPWFATGRLDADDRAAVERHLVVCAICRAEAETEKALAGSMRDTAGPATIPDIDAGWAAMRDRMGEPDAGWPRSAARRPWVRERRPVIGARSLGWFVAAQAAMVVLVAPLLAPGHVPPSPAPAYHALGDTAPGAASNALVMFRPDLSERDLRRLLQSNGARLVGGPTAAHAWVIALPASGRAAALDRLRADRGVTLAQPIDMAPIP